MKIGLLTSSAKSYKNSRFVEELKKAGHKPIVINYLKCYCSLSAGTPMVYYDGKALEDLDAIIPQIGVSTSSFGAAIVRQFEMMGVFTVVGSLALLRTRDKIRSLQLLAKAGVDIPRTSFAHNTSDAGAVIRMVGGAPLIIKITQGSLGKGVMLAETNKSAKSAIDAFFSQSVDVLVQEYIEESEGSDIRAFVVDGKVVAAMKRRAGEGEFRSNIYQGGSAAPVKLNRVERQLALAAAKIMHLPIAGVDLIQSDRGPLVMEVNACPNMEGIEKSSGLNIVGMIIEYIEKNAHGKRKKQDKVGA